MRQISRRAGILILLALACAAAVSLQHDLAQLSWAVLVRTWNLVLLAAVLSLGNYALRVVRWRSYLARLGHPMRLRFAALTYMAGLAYTVSPGKVGEMARSRYYVRLGVPLSDVAAAFLTERLMDVVAMTVLAGLLVTLSAQYRSATLVAVAGVAAALAALGWLPWDRIAAAVNATGGRPAWVQRALASGVGSISAARALLRTPALLLGFAAGLTAWGLEGLGLEVISWAFPAVHLSPLAALGIYGVAVLVGGLSLLPGGLGTTEAVMTALLAAHGFPLAQALIATLLCRLATLWLAVCLGWAAVLGLRPRTLTMVAPWP